MRSELFTSLSVEMLCMDLCFILIFKNLKEISALNNHICQ